MQDTSPRIKKIFIFLVAGLFIFSIVLIFVFSKEVKTKEIETAADLSCVTEEKHTIRGSSMAPALKDGEEVTGLRGYFECNSLEKNQIVILEFKTREGESFVKRVVGKGGDSVEFLNGQAKLNGEILKSSNGEPHQFSKRSQGLLSIPLRDGKIQEGYFFVLSEETQQNAFDSRQYGYVEDEHIKGLVVK